MRIHPCTNSCVHLSLSGVINVTHRPCRHYFAHKSRMSVCAAESEREREGGREGGREGERERGREGERERGRERERERDPLSCPHRALQGMAAPRARCARGCSRAPPSPLASGPRSQMQNRLWGTARDRSAPLKALRLRVLLEAYTAICDSTLGLRSFTLLCRRAC